jgi:hypothetical protein
MASFLAVLGCCLYGCFNSQVGAASANVAVHGCFNLRIRRGWILVQESCCGHDLTCLAIPTLGHIVFNPGLLHWMVSIFGQPFDGSNG